MQKALTYQLPAVDCLCRTGCEVLLTKLRHSPHSRWWHTSALCSSNFQMPQIDNCENAVTHTSLQKPTSIARVILNSLLTISCFISSPKITTSFLKAHQAVVLPFTFLLPVVIGPPELWAKETCFFHLPGCTHHLPAATTLSQVLTILCPCHSQWQRVRKKVRQGRCYIAAS